MGSLGFRKQCYCCTRCAGSGKCLERCLTMDWISVVHDIVRFSFGDEKRTETQTCSKCSESFETSPCVTRSVQTVWFCGVPKKKVCVCASVPSPIHCCVSYFLSFLLLLPTPKGRGAKKKYILKLFLANKKRGYITFDRSFDAVFLD